MTIFRSNYSPKFVIRTDFLVGAASGLLGLQERKECTPDRRAILVRRCAEQKGQIGIPSLCVSFDIEALLSLRRDWSAVSNSRSTRALGSVDRGKYSAIKHLLIYGWSRTRRITAFTNPRSSRTPLSESGVTVTVDLWMRVGNPAGSLFLPCFSFFFTYGHFTSLTLFLLLSPCFFFSPLLFSSSFIRCCSTA